MAGRLRGLLQGRLAFRLAARLGLFEDRLGGLRLALAKEPKGFVDSGRGIGFPALNLKRFDGRSELTNLVAVFLFPLVGAFELRGQYVNDSFGVRIGDRPGFREEVRVGLPKSTQDRQAGNENEGRRTRILDYEFPNLIKGFHDAWWNKWLDARLAL